MITLIRGTISRRFILFTLVQRELRVRYKDSVLGMVWMFGAPLLMMATYSVFVMGFIRSSAPGINTVFSQLAGLWLCLGFWQWFSESANRSATTFHDNSQLVKRMPIPLGLLPLANIIVSSISFAVPLIVSVCFLIADGRNLLDIALCISGIIVLLPWLFALTLIASVAGTYVKDVKHALPLVLNVGMLLSPVLYSLDHAPGFLKAIIQFNPLAPGLTLVRGGEAGPYESGAYVASSAVGILFALSALHFFNRRKKDFYDVV